MFRPALLAAILATPAIADPAPERLHAWTRMPFAFETEAARAAFEAAGTHARAPLAGVEGAPDGTLFVSTPRWLDPAVPSTFSRMGEDGLLHPWPSAEMHDLANPRAIRNALGAFVDGANRMWVLDMGWVAGEDLAPEQAQKLLAFDLATGAEVMRLPLDDVAPRDTSFLNDLFVDEATQTVFITDSGNRGGAPVPAALIVIDLATGTIRRVLDSHASVQDDPERSLTVSGTPVFEGQRLAVGANGIAVAGDRVFWSVTTGDAIYSAAADLLRDPDATDAEIAASIEGPIRIGGGSDGIAVDPQGRLWITNLAEGRLEVLDPGAAAVRPLFAAPDLVWPDSLAPDFAGGMLLSVNHLNSAFAGTLDYDGDDANFAIWRIPMDLAPEDGAADR
ncbi:MAG: L-dopachrome tautomerase-related protein [Pseudomonadota bacterium]